MQWQITSEARRYAFDELARRAGVSAGVLKSWKIDIRNDATVVTLDASGAQIVFPHEPASGNWCMSQVTRCCWMHDPSEELKTHIPDFVVPFVGRVAEGEKPLFYKSSPKTICCSVDLMTSALLTLMCYEEQQTKDRDEHGRFTAQRSLAVRSNFIDRPIVDEYGFGLEQAIGSICPGWEPKRRTYQVKLSHDMDLVGVPFSLRTAIGHTLKRRHPRKTLQDLANRVGIGEPAQLRLVRELARISLERGLDAAFYWMCSEPTKYDPGYNPGERPIVDVIRWLQELGFEQGVHPSYYTFGNPPMLWTQVEKLASIFGVSHIGGRQHYLRWSRDTWADWEQAGLAYDSTVGYAGAAGFRAGTCLPYHPWQFESNRPLKLLEIPLLVMESSLLQSGYMALPQEDALKLVKGLVKRCRLVGGVFTLLFHPASLIEPEYGTSFYLRLLDTIGPGGRYDWRSDEL